MCTINQKSDWSLLTVCNNLQFWKLLKLNLEHNRKFNVPKSRNLYKRIKDTFSLIAHAMQCFERYWSLSVLFFLLAWGEKISFSILRVKLLNENVPEPIKNITLDEYSTLAFRQNFIFLPIINLQTCWLQCRQSNLHFAKKCNVFSQWKVHRSKSELFWFDLDLTNTSSLLAS